MLCLIILAVEHLVREDYKIEAMDRVEAYVDTLLMRMQLIKDRPYVFFQNTKSVWKKFAKVFLIF
jgi:hypothetical protein